MPTVVFAWRRQPPPFLIGGAEVSQQLLAEEFAAAGWRVVYLGCHQTPWNGDDELALMRGHLARLRIDDRIDQNQCELRYRHNGVDCRAVPQDRLERVLTATLTELDPEVIITSQEGSDDLAYRARRTARAIVVGWLHSVSATGMRVLEGRPHYALATSRFVLSRMPAIPATRPLLFYPPFAATVPYQADRTDDILMVNPVPAKGSELIHRLVVRLPDRHFTLVEGWWDTSEEFAAYPNVAYLPRTYDMASLYARHRLQLVPSTVEDAFPRVIVEAALSGLPSVGSSRGGIPEALGPVGRLVPPDDTLAWIQAIEATGAEPDPAGRQQRARAHAASFTRACLPELAAAGVLPD